MKIAEYLRKEGWLFTPEEHKRLLVAIIVKILLSGCLFIGGILVTAIGAKYSEIWGWIGFVLMGAGVLLIMLVLNISYIKYGYKNNIYLQYKKHKDEWEQTDMPENIHELDYIIFNDKKLPRND